MLDGPVKFKYPLQENFMAQSASARSARLPPLKAPAYDWCSWRTLRLRLKSVTSLSVQCRRDGRVSRRYRRCHRLKSHHQNRNNSK